MSPSVGLLRYQWEVLNAETSELLRAPSSPQPRLFFSTDAQSLFSLSHIHPCTFQEIPIKDSIQVSQQHTTTREWYTVPNSPSTYILYFPCRRRPKELKEYLESTKKTPLITHMQGRLQGSKQVKNLAFPQLACSQLASAKISNLLHLLHACRYASRIS